MLKSFFHTGFVVKDLEKSIHFHADVLGMRKGARLERQGEFIEQVLAFPGAHIDRAFMDKGEGHSLELIQYFSPVSGTPNINRNDLGPPTWLSSSITWTGFTPRLRRRVSSSTTRRPPKKMIKAM